MTSSTSVKVAVRIRPNRKKKACVSIPVKNQISILGKEKENSYSFDYVFGQDACQSEIYQRVGKSMLDQAWKGYNICIFAYGQTGSGKSYTVVGDMKGKNPGLIHRLCEDLFSRIEDSQEDNVEYIIESSMLEIYNEKVKDLFNPTNPENKRGLRVREHPNLGPYVVDLASVLVKSSEDILKLMEEGSKMRTIAETMYNATSSRAHTIFSIIFTKRVFEKNSKTGELVATDTVSKIKLVDLAGSERVSKSGTSGQSLKEGTSINLSLTTLGIVINKLAMKGNQKSKKKGKKKKKFFVPYRDSVLTWLLKETLGGNSKTFMIATVSPSSVDYEESLSTLKYANRAKNIKNKAIVNEDANARIIRDLKDEIKKLKSQLDSTDVNKETQQGSGMLDHEKEKLIEKLKESQSIIERLQMTKDQKKKESQSIQLANQKALAEAGLTLTSGRVLGISTSKSPHIVNLNEDPLLAECLVYIFKAAITKVGSSLDCDIILKGIDIQPLHCLIENVDGQYSLTPHSEDSTVYINGKEVTSFIMLKSGDRIIFGDRHVFKYKDPSQVQSNNGVIDWEFARKEFENIQRAQFEEEFQQKAEKLNENMQSTIQTIKQNFEKEKEKHKDKLNELESQRQEALENLKKYEDQNRKNNQGVSMISNIYKKMGNSKLDSDQEKLENGLLRMIPLVKEANEYASQMKKDVKYSIKVLLRDEKPSIGIQVAHLTRNTVNWWSSEIFLERIELMRERYELFSMNEYLEEPYLDDPFYDATSLNIGISKIKLSAIAELRSLKENLDIISDAGEKVGTLDVQIESFSNFDIESSDDLIGKSISFKLKIKQMHPLKKNFCKDCSIRYKFYHDDYQETKPATGKVVDIGFEMTYNITEASEDFINYLEDSYLRFEIFGEFFDKLARVTSPDTPTKYSSSNDPREDHLLDEIKTLKRQLQHYKHRLKANSMQNFASFQKLQISIIRGKGFPSGKNYIKFALKTNKQKTKAIKDSNPKFDESVTFQINAKTSIDDVVYCKLKTFFPIKNQKVSVLFLPLSMLYRISNSQSQTQWFQMIGKHACELKLRIVFL